MMSEKIGRVTQTGCPECHGMFDKHVPSCSTQAVKTTVSETKPVASPGAEELAKKAAEKIIIHVANAPVIPNQFTIEEIIQSALTAHATAVQEVIRWTQAVLTALNAGDVQKESLLHKKLREVMIAYRNQ